MKKVLFISLLLVAVFLIGSAGVAVGKCIDYQDYTCKIHGYKNGELNQPNPFSDCVTLCYDDPFAVTIDDIGGMNYFNGTLYPALDYENLLGTFNSQNGPGGISVEFPSRRSIKVTSEQGAGFVYVSNCTACDGCCH